MKRSPHSPKYMAMMKFGHIVILKIEKRNIWKIYLEEALSRIINTYGKYKKANFKRMLLQDPQIVRHIWWKLSI